MFACRPLVKARRDMSSGGQIVSTNGTADSKGHVSSGYGRVPRFVEQTEFLKRCLAEIEPSRAARFVFAVDVMHVVVGMLVNSASWPDPASLSACQTSGRPWDKPVRRQAAARREDGERRRCTS